MRCNGEDLEVTQELLGSPRPPATSTVITLQEPVWQILLSQLVVLIAWKAREAYVCNLRVVYKRLGNCLAILAML